LIFSCSALEKFLYISAQKSNTKNKVAVRTQPVCRNQQ